MRTLISFPLFAVVWRDVLEQLYEHDDVDNSIQFNSFI
jgi:hypothetical protein